MTGRENSAPNSILIVKLSAIGDVVQTLPMVDALKAEYPEARIDWVVEEDAAELLAGYPALDRVIVSRRKSWQKSFFRKGKFRSTLKEVRGFLKELRRLNYDWVIDNHGIFKSGLLVLFSRGRRKIGYQRSNGIADEMNYLFTNERYKALSIERHALDRYLDLVGQMGVPTAGKGLQFPVSTESRDKARRILGIFSRHPLAIIHPIATWETKQWRGAGFAKVAEALTGRGVSVVFTGSSADQGAVREIIEQVTSPEKVLNLAGQTGLRELAALFSLADVVLTPDTGPMHLAAAVGAPLVALFGPTAPWRTGPYGRNQEILRRSLACSPCFQKKCPTMECMESLSVEEVLSAVDAKLKEAEGTRG